MLFLVIFFWKPMPVPLYFKMKSGWRSEWVSLYMVDIQNVIAEAITASERLIHSITFMVDFDEFFF